MASNDMLAFDTSLALGAGTYWIYAMGTNDFSFSGWLTSDVLNSDWAVQSFASSQRQGYVSGDPARTMWETVATTGLDWSAAPYRLPVSRVFVDGPVDDEVVVPEPASAGLVVFGVLAAGWRRRRCR
ncbi:MAG: PEP-CTERM sorting domain-containing protein [Acidobacteria bacterium]|nr:PEP-CTERM sorting domain-containing protein [Acidobacteriota bacterium]